MSMNKLTKQRREVKSPFTKEERQGVFVTREESRERRNKLNNFSFWKLYTSQWSFKNEGKTLFLYNFISLVISLVVCFGADIDFGILTIMWPAFTLWMFCIYQGIKALVFAPLCYGVYYYAKEGHSEFRQRYREMLTWRK